MNRLIHISFVIILAISTVSCKDKEAKGLKEKLSNPIEVPTAKQKLSKVSIDQYRDAELAYNERYVADLKKTLDNCFEKQLDNFEDNELGFFSSYGNMLDYIFMSNEKFEDSWKVKSTKYFNSLDIESDALIAKSHISRMYLQLGVISTRKNTAIHCHLWQNWICRPRTYIWVT